MNAPDMVLQYGVVLGVSWATQLRGGLGRGEVEESSQR